MNAKKVTLSIIAAAIIGSMTAVPVLPAMAATSAVSTNNTATKNDLANADIIDESKSGSLSIFKYDITAAEAAGDYEEGTYKATGQSDSRVENALKDYAVEGVQFSYLRVGNAETHSVNDGTKAFVELVYEIPTELASILGLSASDAVDMTTASEAQPCTNTGVLHFTSQQVSDAIADILTKDSTAAKNALENYFYNYGTFDSTTDQAVKGTVKNMPKTDATGHTSVNGLELGLYLIVETEVPENVTETVNPWFVQLPFTNTSAQTAPYGSDGTHNGDGVTNSDHVSGTEANVSGGEQWLYDMTCYPKNQSGNPTLDKSVRNAYSNTAETDKNGKVNKGNDYISDKASNALAVYNNDTNNPNNSADTSDAAYIANRGGYTADGVTAGKNGAGYSTDFQYRDTNTASEGDILDYILVSKLPHITSRSTYLSEYTFVDTLSKGLTYNKDVKIAFFDNAADANANNTKNSVAFWDLGSGDYTQEYVEVTVTDPMTGSSSDGSTRLTVRLTEEGLKILNENPDGSGKPQYKNTVTDASGNVTYKEAGFSDYYMVVYYTATVNSDASMVLGDEGNPNNVKLLWSRTSDGYSNVLEDENFIYSYGIDLTKTFSDNQGKFENVQFKLYNSTDAYYVVAKKDADGLYYVTGKTTDESKATTFVPAADGGTMLINGIEADEYQLTEVATDDGYSLLKEQIVIDITPTDRDIIASVAGVTGMDADAAAAIAANYNGGIYDENGNLVTANADEITGADVPGPKKEAPNGNDIGKTDMYVGAIRPASATIDAIAANMRADVTSDSSENASVLLSVENSKSFLLPKTGGNGLYIMTIVGVIVAAGGIYLVTRKKKVA